MSTTLANFSATEVAAPRLLVRGGDFSHRVAAQPHNLIYGVSLVLAGFSAAEAAAPRLLVRGGDFSHRVAAQPHNLIYGVSLVLADFSATEVTEWRLSRIASLCDSPLLSTLYSLLF